MSKSLTHIYKFVKEKMPMVAAGFSLRKIVRRKMP